MSIDASATVAGSRERNDYDDMLERLEAYQGQYRELDAIHTVLTDKNELYELSAEQLKPYIDL